KATPWKTSFLPSEELANMWKMVGAPLPASIKIDEGGVCTTCYKHPNGEPEWMPPDGGAPVSPPPPADAGAPADVAPSPPVPAPDAAAPPVTPPRPEPEPEPEPDAGTAAPPRGGGGCNLGRAGASP